MVRGDIVVGDLVYLVIGFGMNVVYTLGWVIELILKPYMSEQLKISFPKKAFYRICYNFNLFHIWNRNLFTI